jgi:hypothetical protein
VGDVAERSTVVNSLAAQEFGSDYSDPYLVRAVGLSVETPSVFDFHPRLTASYEWQSPLAVHARPVRGTFEPTVPAFDVHATRFALEVERPTELWIGGTEVSVRGDARWTNPHTLTAAVFDTAGPRLIPVRRPLALDNTLRGALTATLERPFDLARLVTAASVAGISGSTNGDLPQELVYLGGPVSAPGYDYHSIVTTFGYTAHAEVQLPAPFPAFSLGRYGRVPGRGTFAPYVHLAGAKLPGVAGGQKLFPSLGGAYITPFDLLRIDVAKGLATGGRWTFNVDVSREFWSIL